MTRMILSTILISILLTSCITIKEEPKTPESQQAFATALLAPTKVQLLLPTFTVTSEPSVTPVLATATSVNCTDSAILLRDITVQDDTRVDAGEKITKTWEFQNTGTCPWVDYTIEFSSGDQMDAPLSVPVADTPPKEKVQVSVELTAPTADGRYTGYFALLNSNGDVIPIGTEKTFWVRFIVGAYATNPVSSGTVLTPSGNCSYGPNGNYVNEIVSLVNTERANAGLQTLTVNWQIAAFAQGHAEDMAYNNFLSHDGSDGTFGERLASYNTGNFSYKIYGEILAIGTPQNAMDQWHKDAHWDYVLGNFTQIGVGYAYNSCSDYGGYFTVDFGN